jgi:hypothetical protein
MLMGEMPTLLQAPSHTLFRLPLPFHEPQSLQRPK